MDVLKDLATQFGLLVSILIIGNVAQAGAITWLVRTWREDISGATEKYTDALEKVAATNEKVAVALNSLATSQAEVRGAVSRIGVGG